MGGPQKLPNLWATCAFTGCQEQVIGIKSLHSAARSGPGVAGPGVAAVHTLQAGIASGTACISYKGVHHLLCRAANSLTNTALPLPLQFFVVGHDCGHRSFSKNKLVEDIVGTLAFAPLIYPFEPWRIKHNHHHAHTNKCAGLLHSAA